MANILITGFKPFGIIGTLTGINSSEQMIEELKIDYPESDTLNYLVLPVNDTAAIDLKEKIKTFKPQYVISLGEGGSFNIELYCHRRKTNKTSRFAESLIENINQIKEHSMDSTIGNYYCNDIYYTALTLVPDTVFIHLPSLLSGSYKEYHKQMIKNIIEYVKI